MVRTFRAAWLTDICAAKTAGQCDAVSKLWSVTDAGLAAMSALWKAVKKLKRILLSVVLVGGLALAVDVSRLPANQLTARSYVGCVRVYQAIGRPLLKGKIACRY